MIYLYFLAHIFSVFFICGGVLHPPCTAPNWVLSQYRQNNLAGMLLKSHTVGQKSI